MELRSTYAMRIVRSQSGMMEGSRLELDAPMRQLLTEVAYAACMTNDVVRARRIFDGLAAVEPDSQATAIGYALADMTVRDFTAAATRLQPLVSAGDTAATILLGITLKLAGRTGECDALLARLPPDDPATVALAGALR